MGHTAGGWPGEVYTNVHNIYVHHVSSTNECVIEHLASGIAMNLSATEIMHVCGLGVGLTHINWSTVSNYTTWSITYDTPHSHLWMNAAGHAEAEDHIIANLPCATPHSEAQPSSWIPLLL